LKLNSLNHFRALAIVLIVATHSFTPVGIDSDSFINCFVKNLLAGSTSLFVFISGFLFYEVFYRNFSYKKFVSKKITKLIFPYIILGLFPVVVALIIRRDHFDGYFLPTGVGFFSEYMIPFFKYYFTGRFLNAYWYIPFITVMFLLSPLHYKFVSIKFRLQVILVLALSSISIFMHRPVLNVSVFQSVVYFTPIYFIGIISSIHKANIYAFFKSREWILLFIALSFAFYQTYIGDVGSYQKPPFEYSGLDLVYLQKVFLCLFLMVFLNRFENIHFYPIDIVASTSFAIYFIHPFIPATILMLKIEYLKLNSWFVFILFITLVTVFCVFIAIFTKKILPKYSKYIIGY
jgi:hypothetical protein